MEKILLDAHPSVMFIYSKKDNGEVLLGGYDGGYPRTIYASAPNLLGGNPEAGDETNGPHNVLVREITEEVAKGDKDVDWKQRPVQWVSLDDILKIRNGILDNTQPFADFLVDAEGIMVRPRDRQEKVRMSDVYKAIYSAFRAEIPEDIFELARKNIYTGKRFWTEGFIGIHPLRQLEAAGEYSTSHITANVLNDYFGLNIPSPEQLKVSNIGDVRSTYSDYNSDFEHTERVWGAK